MSDTNHILPPQARRVRAVADTIIAEPAPTYYAPSLYGQRYVLPCTFLGGPGFWEYVLCDVEQARRWLLQPGPCGSYVTHPLLLEALERLIGFALPPPRRGPLPLLGFHDEGLVFSVENYETLPDLRRGSSRLVDRMVKEERWTLGTLRRLG